MLKSNNQNEYSSNGSVCPLSPRFGGLGGTITASGDLR